MLWDSTVERPSVAGTGLDAANHCPVTQGHTQPVCLYYCIDEANV